MDKPGVYLTLEQYDKFKELERNHETDLFRVKADHQYALDEEKKRHEKEMNNFIDKIQGDEKHVIVYLGDAPGKPRWDHHIFSFVPFDKMAERLNGNKAWKLV